MAWSVELHPEVADWLNGLGEKDYLHVIAAFQALAEDGPSMGRPYVDTVRNSHHANMKELRPRGGHLRILFAFDPSRTAVMLVAGDKSKKWQRWYDDNLPIADRRLDERLRELKGE